jgi:hypothetical protein
MLLYWIHVVQEVDGVLKQGSFICRELKVSTFLLPQSLIRLRLKAAECGIYNALIELLSISENGARNDDHIVTYDIV